MADIVKAYQSWRNSLANRKHTRVITKADLEARYRVQIREFGGKCCLSIDNIPLIKLDGYDAVMLDNARETLKQYLITQGI